MRITPLDIRRQEFKKVFKGYDPHEVNVFLEIVAKDMEDLIRENTELTERARELDGKIEDYKRMEKTLQDTLTSAQRATDELRRNAEKEAELIVRNAKIQADHILEEARRKVQELETRLSFLRHQKDAFISQFRGLLLSALKTLESEGEGDLPSGDVDTEGSAEVDSRERRGGADIGELFKENT